MINTVVLSRCLGFYQRIHEHGCVLENTHQYLPSGTEIEVGKPQTMSTDTRTVSAIPFWIKGEEFFFLEEEFEKSIHKFVLV